MEEPTIVYGTLEQPMHTNAQYLLMEAGIGNREYPTPEFIEAIEGVSLDGIRKAECKRDVEVQKSFLKSFAGMGDTVTIKNFNPDREKLESFVDITFGEMYDQSHGRG